MNIFDQIQTALCGSVRAQIRLWKLLLTGRLVPIPIRLFVPETRRRFPLSPSEGERAGVRASHRPCRVTLWQLAFVAGALALVWPLRVLATGEQQFATPEAAVSALETAARSRDTNAMHAIFGPAGRDLVSPDAVQATQEFEAFVNRLSEKTELVRRSDSNCVLQLGADAWPFPIPLVKVDGQWSFDTEAGRQEVLNRRVGRNELGALAVCRAYVDAQREYAGKDRNGDEVLEYAQRLRSTPGTHDGLYWPLRGGDE